MRLLRALKFVEGNGNFKEKGTVLIGWKTQFTKRIHGKYEDFKKEL